MTASINRLFLIIEGNNNAYPNFNNAKVHFLADDPCTVKLSEQFISSPIFPLVESGYNKIPEIKEGTKITFAMVPSIVPSFYDLLTELKVDETLWFSLGLANLIIVENVSNTGITKRVIEHLKTKDNLTAYESWTLDADCCISKSPGPQLYFATKDSKVVDCNQRLSEKLPLNLKFSVSEYIISVNKLLTASKKFTPQYFLRHLRTIEVTQYIVADLSFLHGDFSFSPTIALINSLGAKDLETAKEIIENKTINVENLINEKHWMIIQFNSSLSYIYSQAYAGTFPLFDHFGIVRRHSFLGLGTAIAALYELIIQLEIAFYHLPFENIKNSQYESENIPSNYLDIIFEPAEFTSNLWKNDLIKQHVIGGDILSENKKCLPETYYNRLSFFSGRLGFKEYEFSATAAIQVVVEANSLPWHIINYTHEIIHNHVRTLLNQLILVQQSARENDFGDWIGKYRDIIKNIFKVYGQAEKQLSISYFEYFTTVLLKYIVNVNIYGSLSVSCDLPTVKKLQGAPEEKIKYILPYSDTLREGIRHYYKDITEIFVHVIDFCYVYKEQINIYLPSVWTSWSTVSAVINDLKQYISRSLLVVALSVDGTSNNRYEKAKSIFRSIISDMSSKGKNIVFKSVLEILDCKEEDDDLRYRFYNCVIVGDLVYNFFVGKLQGFLDDDDNNVIPPVEAGENEATVNYYISTNSFQGQRVISKVRFLFDQLGREIFKNNNITEDGYLERTSAWLLLLLSSNDENK